MTTADGDACCERGVMVMQETVSRQQAAGSSVETSRASQLLARDEDRGSFTTVR